MGVPFCFYTIYNFGMELIRQVSGITGESRGFEALFRLRYALVVGYFAACIISPRYAFESKSPETPLLFALIIDAIRLVYDFDGMSLIRFAFLVIISGGCLFLRKRSTWKILLNTWKEDVDEEEDAVGGEPVNKTTVNKNKATGKFVV